jgi:hypothetical protein
MKAFIIATLAALVIANPIAEPGEAAALVSTPSSTDLEHSLTPPGLSRLPH